MEGIFAALTAAAPWLAMGCGVAFGSAGVRLRNERLLSNGFMLAAATMLVLASFAGGRLL